MSTQKPIRIGCYSCVVSAVLSSRSDAFPLQWILGVRAVSAGYNAGFRLICHHRDSMLAAKQLVEAEKDALDFLVADYLAGSHFVSVLLNEKLTRVAEVTMGLLARRSRHHPDPKKRKPGYSESPRFPRISCTES